MKYNPDIHNRHSIRLRNWDYANTDSYFVTICCQNMKHLFGNVINGKMILNEYGEIAHNEWLNTTKIRKNIKLHEFVIMPNHVHAIIEICCNWGKNYGKHENVYGNVCEKGVCDTPLRDIRNKLQSPSNTIGAIIRGYKSAVTNQIHRTGVLHTPNNQNAPNPPIWQRNYYEHVIRNETEFARIAKYIRNNPISWGQKTPPPPIPCIPS